MAINWKTHEFIIEDLAKAGKKDELIKQLIAMYHSDIDMLLSLSNPTTAVGLSDDDEQYYKSLQKTLKKLPSELKNPKSK